MDTVATPDQQLPEPQPFVALEAEKKFFSKKNIIISIIFLLLLSAIPATVLMLQRTQTLKSSASGPAYTRKDFLKLPSSESCDWESLECTTSTDSVEVTLATPYPPEFTAVPINTPTPSATVMPPVGDAAPTAPAVVPTVPPSSMTASCTDGKAKLDWGQVNGADYYWYTYGQGSDFVGWQKTTLPPPINDIDITKSGNYDWYVYAKFPGVTADQDKASKGTFTCP